MPTSSSPFWTSNWVEQGGVAAGSADGVRAKLTPPAVATRSGDQRVDFRVGGEAMQRPFREAQFVVDRNLENAATALDEFHFCPWGHFELGFRTESRCLIASSTAIFDRDLHGRFLLAVW